MAEIGEGSVIGNYRVIRLLGQGGMGAVYEVEHVELGTHYALKTFTYEADDAFAGMLLNKFREEAKILSRIDHPCVSRAFDLTHDTERGLLKDFVVVLREWMWSSARQASQNHPYTRSSSMESRSTSSSEYDSPSLYRTSGTFFRRVKILWLRRNTFPFYGNTHLPVEGDF